MIVSVSMPLFNTGCSRRSVVVSSTLLADFGKAAKVRDRILSFKPPNMVRCKVAIRVRDEVKSYHRSIAWQGSRARLHPSLENFQYPCMPDTECRRESQDLNSKLTPSFIGGWVMVTVTVLAGYCIHLS